MKKSIQDKVKTLKGLFDPKHVTTQLAKSFLPQVVDTLKMAQRPESEGGILKEDEEKVGLFVVLQKNKDTGEDQLSFSTCAMKKVPEGVLISRITAGNTLEEILKEKS